MAVDAYYFYNSVNKASCLQNTQDPVNKKDEEQAEEAMHFFALICELAVLLNYTLDPCGAATKIASAKLKELLEKIQSDPDLKNLIGGDAAVAKAKDLMNAINQGNAQGAANDCSDLQDDLESFLTNDASVIDYLLSHMSSTSEPEFSDRAKAFLGEMAMIAFVLSTVGHNSDLGKKMYENFFHNVAAVLGDHILADVLKDELQREFGKNAQTVYETFIAGAYLTINNENAPEDIRNLFRQLMDQGWPKNPPAPASAYDYEQIRKAAEHCWEE